MINIKNLMGQSVFLIVVIFVLATFDNAHANLGLILKQRAVQTQSVDTPAYSVEELSKFNLLSPDDFDKEASLIPSEMANSPESHQVFLEAARNCIEDSIKPLVRNFLFKRGYFVPEKGLSVYEYNFLDTQVKINLDTWDFIVPDGEFLKLKATSLISAKGSKATYASGNITGTIDQSNRNYKFYYWGTHTLRMRNYLNSKTGQPVAIGIVCAPNKGDQDNTYAVIRDSYKRVIIQFINKKR